MIAIRRHPPRHADSRFERVGRLPHAFDPHRSPAASEDYMRLVGEATVLRQKRVQIGMAIILGNIDKRTCVEIKRTIAKLADYISYANWGPLVVVAFQRCLFEQLKPMWQELLVGAPGICAGVAFPDDDIDTHELVLAARLALTRAVDSHYSLVAFNEEESMAAVTVDWITGGTNRLPGREPDRLSPAVSM